MATLQGSTTQFHFSSKVLISNIPSITDLHQHKINKKSGLLPQNKNTNNIFFHIRKKL